MSTSSRLPIRRQTSTSDGKPARIRSWWAVLSLLPLGFGSWAPLYAGVRARVASWTALGAFWSSLAVAGWVVSATSSGTSTVAGLLLVLAWAGAAATSFVIRPAYERRMSSPLLDASERAEQRLRDRRRALELGRRNPTLAREIGIGRPDIAGAADAGLVDVNNASASALTSLAGVDDELATRIVEARAQIGGFSSIEDLGIALDLDGHTVESLRDRAIFLPR